MYTEYIENYPHLFYFYTNLLKLQLTTNKKYN